MAGGTGQKDPVAQGMQGGLAPRACDFRRAMRRRTTRMSSQTLMQEGLKALLTEGEPESIDYTGTRPGGSKGPPSRGAGGAGQKDPVALEMQDVSCPKEEETQSGRTAASDSVEHPSEPARG